MGFIILRREIIDIDSRFRQVTVRYLAFAGMTVKVMMKERGFTFGKNWLFFVDKYFNQERIEDAKKSLVDFSGGYNFKGKSFLDIGCGSGLFSLAAYQLRASKVISFDLDPDSVASCWQLKKKEGHPSNWEIKKGSILNEKFLSELGKFDFVYAWGVLHHTGKMWLAMENTLDLVAKKGFLYLAIYNKADSWGFYPDGRFGSSGFWVKVKRRYSNLPSFYRSAIDYLVMSVLILSYLLRLKNPIKEIGRHPEKFRGMSWRADISDWLGGYPYEYASVDEVFSFIKKRGFSLENLKANNGLMNNEYLFKKI